MRKVLVGVAVLGCAVVGIATIPGPNVSAQRSPQGEQGKETKAQSILTELRLLRKEISLLRDDLGRKDQTSKGGIQGVVERDPPLEKESKKIKEQDPKSVGVLEAGWTYRFGIKTGTGRHPSGDYAGTDCDVMVRVIGRGASDWLNCDLDGDDFEMGDHRYYTFRPSARADLLPTAIEVRFRDLANRHNPRWQLSSITFEDWDYGYWQGSIWTPHEFL